MESKLCSMYVIKYEIAMTIIKLHASTWVNLIQHYAEWKKQDPEEYILKKDINFKNKPKIHIMVGR